MLLKSTTLRLRQAQADNACQCSDVIMGLSKDR
jgi:hypothetical protein